MSSSYLFLLFVVHVVSCKAIYDIHASDRANTSEPFAIQRPRLASNGQVLAGGLKRLQPPRSISRAIVKAKKERSNPVDTAPMAKRSNVPTIAPCGFINGFSADGMELIGNLDAGPTREFVHAVASVLTFLPLTRQVYLPPNDPSGFVDILLGPDILDSTNPTPPGSPFGAAWGSFTNDHSVGPFSLGSGSSNFAFLTSVPATTGPAQLSGTPNPGEPANDPLDPPIATESDIWTFNPLTLELTASWTNPDGSRSPVTIFFDQDPDFGNVGITGDLADVISASQASLAQSRAPPVGPSAVPIRLFYVNIDPEVCASIIA